jgi:hypothetical protein
MQLVFPRTYFFQLRERLTSLSHVDVFKDISLTNYLCMLFLALQSHARLVAISLISVFQQYLTCTYQEVSHYVVS